MRLENKGPIPGVPCIGQTRPRPPLYSVGMGWRVVSGVCFWGNDTGQRHGHMIWMAIHFSTTASVEMDGRSIVSVRDGRSAPVVKWSTLG